MNFTRLCLAASAAALIATSASAQTAAETPAPVQTPAPAAAWTPIQASGDIAATLEASGKFTRFIAAAKAANLYTILKTQPNITVFAPTDAALNALPTGTIEQLTSSNQIQGRIAYHIVNTRITGDKIAGKAGAVPAVAGGSVYLDGTKTPAMVNHATLLQTDITASNGVVHVVDKLLTPGFTPPASPPMVEAAPAETSPAN